MAPSGPFRTINAVVNANSLGVDTPNLQRITATLANNEYNYLLPDGTKLFTIRAAGTAKLHLAFATGEVVGGNNYRDIWPGETYESPFLNSAAVITLYFSSSLASEVIEIESWS